MGFFLVTFSFHYCSNVKKYSDYETLLFLVLICILI